MQCIDCLTDIGSVEIMFVAKTYFTRMGNVFILDQKYLYICNIIVLFIPVNILVSITLAVKYRSLG